MIVRVNHARMEPHVSINWMAMSASVDLVLRDCNAKPNSMNAYPINVIPSERKSALILILNSYASAVPVTLEFSAKVNVIQSLEYQTS